MYYDIVIIGASFSGLSLAHHLPKKYRVLVIDRKKTSDYYVESTGLITQVTKDLFDEFIDVSKYIPNSITTIGVVGTDFSRHFFSNTEKPWIYSTDTPNLIKAIAEKLPQNVEYQIQAHFKNYTIHKDDEYPVHVKIHFKDGIKTIKTKFLVGADGSRSSVANANKKLSKNKRFLAAWEKVFYGKIHLGEHPEQTVYHFWFGEFSLGYGGWLSPTIINGKSAFRLGLAKLAKDVKDLKRIQKFIKILEEKGIIAMEPGTKEILSFSSLVPIGGPVKVPYDQHILLIGDAAGFCGPFAADGIKGSLVSGKVAAKLIPEYLEGNTKALKGYHAEMEKSYRLMTYFRKQLLYRFLWNQMKSNRSFDILFELISRKKDHFLDQFCDSKESNKSLFKIILQKENIRLIMHYALSVVADFFKTEQKPFP